MMRNNQLVRRNFTSVDGPTTIALESKYWQVLEEMASKVNKAVAVLLCEIDGQRFEPNVPRRVQSPPSLASAVRVHVVEYLHGQSVKAATQCIKGEMPGWSPYTGLSDPAGKPRTTDTLQ